MNPTLIILAAGRGTRLKHLTETKPKCMIEVCGKPIIEWQVMTARQAGIKRIIIVTGHLSDAVNIPGVTYVRNARYSQTNMVESLFTARSYFSSFLIVSYGDILYEKSVIEKIINAKSQITVAVDNKWKLYWEERFSKVFLDAETLKVDSLGRIKEIGQKTTDIKDIQGQYIGLSAFKGDGLQSMQELYDMEKSAYQEHKKFICKQRNLDQLYMTDLIQGLINQGCNITSIPISGDWLEIDSLQDLELAGRYADASSGSLKISR